jgi:hypothetical protein
MMGNDVWAERGGGKTAVSKKEYKKRPNINLFL